MRVPNLVGILHQQRHSCVGNKCTCTPYHGGVAKYREPAIRDHVVIDMIWFYIVSYGRREHRSRPRVRGIRLLGEGCHGSAGPEEVGHAHPPKCAKETAIHEHCADGFAPPCPPPPPKKLANWSPIPILPIVSSDFRQPSAYWPKSNMNALSRNVACSSLNPVIAVWAVPQKIAYLRGPSSVCVGHAALKLPGMAAAGNCRASTQSSWGTTLGGLGVNNAGGLRAGRQRSTRTNC